ncbi:hypothetical protein A2316_03240 [Candidatus Falkowbacteria bacterium RIFOXYB2_FULL_38_15]|uniref:Right handed beta helix domain-containing protein n=1 Tax=Candidatus Falkowbacteria bacterium RIFOXYA2_FULL_38_12 TaxID=1797993 RepID=A0A1F5S4I2_9BACT|nr:MAG: hypothetical protein A2257_00995 [Candidatus Falkowbacteria bacterium RIFOXYA2_FULL_38_12]OGF33738.1 MAG: hypothetical protein A2316_03240 [Candidatus Falkowbacteria bacterium RIFOXYB2_FULL_38_15]OGF42392.1 MAG: hypothetical protein A2555_00395 [Candidatus Falkowbacteria bacterium RIFOXYD2_FULL_39_16]
MKKIITFLLSLSLIIFNFNPSFAATTIAERVKGKIVLQVESHGEAYYIYPDNLKRYFLGRPQNAFDIMRSLGLGITNANLAKIPKNNDSWTGETTFINRVKGKILLQVEQNGEAWYVYPNNGKRYFLGRPSDAFNIMRSLGLGITTTDLSKIALGTISGTGSTGGTSGGDTPGDTGDTGGNTNTEDPNSIIVSNVSALNDALENANNGIKKTILVENGTYTINNMLWVSGNGVTVRSRSGNREAVILQGDGMAGSVSHIFNVAGNNFSVKDMTLKRVANHAIQLQANVDGFSANNIHFLDTGEQMLKIAYDAGNMSASSDNGLVENSLFEYSAGRGPQYYIGGVDAHNAKNWIVRGNTFKSIKSPSDNIAEFAIHFWSESENTLVERNTIINCDRGIGFGLGDRGHVGGIIRNNMIYHDSSEGFADVQIGLEDARNSQVYNNTIYMANSYPNAIEYRFGSTTGLQIYNNLTNKAISARDGASGTASNNVTNAMASWFVAPASGNLHLKSSISSVVDQGRTISGLTNDFDKETRPKGSGIDIGADEF